MANIKNLLLALGVATTVGGVSYQLFDLKPDTSKAALLDAGLFNVCPPVMLEMEGRWDPECVTGNPMPRYLALKMTGAVCDADAGLDKIITNVPNKNDGGPCFKPSPSAGSVRFLGAIGTCTDPTICDGGLPAPRLSQPRCACRPTDAGVCRFVGSDGGTPLMQFGRTYDPPFAGAGCVRRACEEMDGEQGQGMPPECL